MLCLGFLYHTLRYNELMALIRQCGPEYLIIDTEVATDPRAMIQIRTESVAHSAMPWPTRTRVVAAC